LESEEGGQFHIGEETNELCLIRYEKGTSNMNLPHSRWFRSVVWDKINHLPVCVSPPKATSTEFPFLSIEDAIQNGIICQELLDGVMINCFKKAGDDQLYVTSRSKLNAAGNFYSSKSFRTLFIESYTGYHVDPNMIEQIIQERAHKFASPDKEKKEVAIFYSYVIQHEEHRIVTPIARNNCTLLHKGTVYEDGRIAMEDGFPFAQSGVCQFSSNKGSYAKVVESSGQTIAEWVKHVFEKSSWKFQGMVLKDSMGNRWRYRSDKYAAVKSLRGNSPQLIERFAQLYTQNLIPNYLEYYPEEQSDFSHLLDKMTIIIQTIYQLYVDVHITKCAGVIDKMYRSHLYALHGIYLSQKKKLTPLEVHIYLHKQPWQRIAFLLKHT